MKYLVLALLVASALADEDMPIEGASFPVMNLMNMQKMGYSVMGNTMYNNPMFIPKPPQKAIDHYKSLNDDDFPVDYSMACSNSCGCRQTCVMMWWMPCGCACPPPCPTPTEAPTIAPPMIPPNWLPPRFPQPEPVPPQQWLPRPGPEPLPPQNIRPWQPAPPAPPNPQFPSLPNLNIPRLTTTQGPQTFPPQPWPGTPSPWNPNNPQNPPVWTPEPIWPQPNPPQTNPQWPWQQQPNQPVVPLPEPLPPTWNNNNNWNNNNQFPGNWPQQPGQPAPPREDCSVCNAECSCTPCSVIWVCPPPCPASCCNGVCARHFGDVETSDYQKEEQINEGSSSKNAFRSIPEYLQDVFIPGQI